MRSQCEGLEQQAEGLRGRAEEVEKARNSHLEQVRRARRAQEQLVHQEQNRGWFTRTFKSNEFANAQAVLQQHSAKNDQYAQQYGQLREQLAGVETQIGELQREEQQLDSARAALKRSIEMRAHLYGGRSAADLIASRLATSRGKPKRHDHQAWFQRQQTQQQQDRSFEL